MGDMVRKQNTTKIFEKNYRILLWKINNDWINFRRLRQVSRQANLAKLIFPVKLNICVNTCIKTITKAQREVL